MIEYYIGTLQECLDLDVIISGNCNWPLRWNVNWANPQETVDTGVYSLEVPQGSHGFTKTQMNKNITSPIVMNVEFSTEEE